MSIKTDFSLLMTPFTGLMAAPSQGPLSKSDRERGPFSSVPLLPSVLFKQKCPDGCAQSWVREEGSLRDRR